MSDQQKNQRLDQAFAALLSKEDAKVLGALAEIDQRGDARAILPLLHALVHSTSTTTTQRILAMLYEVKVTDAAAELIRALDVPDLAPVRKTVLATFWNAGLDAAPYTDRIVRCAIEGDAEECFECLTVIENQELLPERAVLKAIKDVGAAIARNTDDYKGAMLGSLLVELQARVGR